MTTIDPKLIKSEDGRTVLLKGVRLSFTKRLKNKAKTSEVSQKETHGCNVLLQPDQPNFEVNKALIMHAIRAAGKQAFQNENAFQSIAEDNPKRVCYRSGSKWKNKTGKVYAGYEGGYAFSASGPQGGDSRPKLFDRHRQEVKDVEAIPGIFYGGVNADVIVAFYGTDKGGSRGIFCTIESIRSHQTGERLDGGGYDATADDFDDFGDEDAFETAAAGPKAGGGGSAAASFEL